MVRCVIAILCVFCVWDCEKSRSAFAMVLFLPGFIAAAVQRKSLEGSALRGRSGATGDLAAWGGSSEEEAEAGAGKKRIRKKE